MTFYVQRPISANSCGETKERYFNMDLLQTDKNYYVELDVPGVKEEDLDLQLEDGVLKVSLQLEEKDDARMVLHKERFSGKTEISRSIPLPKDSEGSQMQASLSMGILSIEIPRKEELKPQKIAIKSA